MKLFRFLFVLGLAGGLVADTVVMKNGDKLTGTVLTTTDKGVVFKSEFAGEVTIAVENIREVETAQPATITTKDGRKLSGTVRTQGDQITIVPPTGEPTTVARDAVAAVRSPEGQTKFEELEMRKLHPEFLDLYAGFFDFGIALARGNALSDSYAATGKLNRITDKDNFGIYFTQIHSAARVGGVKADTAHAIRGGWNYSRTLRGSRWFLQGFNDYEYDRFLGLDLRVVLGGGLGYYLIKNDRGFLSVFGGLAWNREQFNDGLLRNSTEVYVGQEWVYKLNRIWAVNEKLVFFPNVSNTGAYRINFDASLAAALNRILSLQFSASNRYLSNPIPGRQTNDMLFTAGIRATIPTREKGK